MLCPAGGGGEVKGSQNCLGEVFWKGIKIPRISEFSVSLSFSAPPFKETLPRLP